MGLLAATLAAGGRKHPLRVVVPVEYAERQKDPLMIGLQSYLTPLLEVLPEFAYPEWSEVEESVRYYMNRHLGYHSEAIRAQCAWVYDEFAKNPARRQFSALGEALSDILGEYIEHARTHVDPSPSKREPSRLMMSSKQPSPRHKVFVSYHHAGDESYKELLTGAVFRDAFVDLSVRPKEVDDNLPTERIRQIMHNPRTGLLGIVLPTYRVPGWDGVARATYRTEPNRTTYCPNNIPPRLWDNVKKGFAIMRPWPSSPAELSEWIHEAFLRRNQQPSPDLSYPTFSNNRSESSNAWDPPVR